MQSIEAIHMPSHFASLWQTEEETAHYQKVKKSAKSRERKLIKAGYIKDEKEYKPHQIGDIVYSVHVWRLPEKKP